MLQTKTVEPETLSLLKDLMKVSSLKPFSLVGGTTLSLLYRQLNSEDLDLFYHEKFDQSGIAKDLESEFIKKYSI
jgi:hypothetical protein